MKTKFLKINTADNVAVAIENLSQGEVLQIDGTEVQLQEEVPAGHKFALKPFAQGEDVIKYGYPIGHTLQPIAQGCWINERNLKTNLSGLLEYSYQPVDASLQIPNRGLTFKGYRRANGEVGIRNEIWVVPTVGCVNGIASRLADSLRSETGCQGVDAIMA